MRRTLPGVPELDLIEIIAEGVDEEHLHQLQDVHLRHFPDHPQVAAELAEEWAGVRGDPEVVVHAWLALRGGIPAGEFIFHTNLRRGIVLQHFHAVDRTARGGLPFAWLGHLVDEITRTAMNDLADVDRSLLGNIGEVGPEHVEGWSRFGYSPMPVDYQEPHHGRSWPEHGPLQFFTMVPLLRRTATGQSMPRGEVAVAALSAFLLDYYRLPADEPTVAATLALAAALE